MTSALAQRAGLKLFEQHIQQYQPADPLYETYTDAKGRQKTRKRELPPGLSKRDAKILKSIKRRAHYLDKGFRICGLRFGWTFVIGIIPGAGNVADAALNYFLVLRKARKADLPDWLVRKMLLNNVVSVAAGFIPIAGDIILAQYKANSRNAALLEEFLRIRGEEFLKLQAGRGGADAAQQAAVLPGAGREADERIPAPTKQDAIPEHKVPEPERAVLTPAGTSTGTKGPAAPASSGSGGLFKGWKSGHSSDKGRFVENVAH